MVTILGWIDRLLGARRDEVGLPLYEAVVAAGRQPHWYLAGGVPDTVDGRFDTIAAVLSVAMLRLEAEPTNSSRAEPTNSSRAEPTNSSRAEPTGDVQAEHGQADPVAMRLSVALAERFVDDMDGQLRQGGIGDIVVGKRVGKLMAMLGGRLGAYRDGMANGTLDAALARNLYRGDPPGDASVAHVRDALLALRDRLAATPVDALARGELP